MKIGVSMTLTIHDVAQRTGLTTYTLRYYAKEGLLDFVTRSSNKLGTRLFKESDLEFIYLIKCLKNAGLSIKEIKTFVDWTMAGDSTIAERRDMFQKRRTALQQQMADLQATLDVVNYKYWYYQVAENAGTCAVHDGMPDAEIPEKFRQVKHRLSALDGIKDA
ncbi:MerR family transcriptional regulator [Lactiplantibacillus pentosus]|uniref:Transcriptional regulator, merr family n=3 Tax=Lactiplantibacillus pentosus TaxID=1589 RepID=A0A837R8H1_LACPE|nr:MerR family transcriptional regulator [Lactiplantibacillus pentosus]KRK22938.1 transcriptional regulator, merr family [Lactiplantibacillus pentosus DSM 20314]